MPFVAEGDTAMAELDIDRAIRCAKASKLAYAEPGNVDEKARVLGFADANVALIKKKNHGAVTIMHPDCSIFAFRGTDGADLDDWRTNVNFPPVESPLGEVHGGFWAAMELFSEELQAFADDAGQQKRFLTGHSLGGAMGCLARVRIDSALTGLYTYAQPPVGTRDFAERFLRKFGPAYFRIVNFLDDAPSAFTPFLDPAKAMRPMGPPFELYSGGELRSEPSAWLAIRDRSEYAVRSAWKRATFDIHSVDEHIRRLELLKNAS
ncbi:MAG: lipase family protein [Pseudomonadota bacterium]